MAMDDIRYYDVRHVRGEVTHIDLDNTVVESAGTSFFDTAVIRVLGLKGWGVLTLDHFSMPTEKGFNELLNRGSKIASVTAEQVILADALHGVLPVPKMTEDPSTVPTDEKIGLLAGIEKAARIPGIKSTRATYSERTEEVMFFDSSGNEFEYSVCRSGFTVLAVAARNGSVQMGYETEHTIRGLNIRQKEETGREAAERALALLDARAPKGGTMNAVLDPELAGVFAHEAVGHASEGDTILEGSSVLAGKTGERIGSEILTISDDPALPEFGFEPVDAEGSSVRRTDIILKGKVNAYLHNRETLAVLGNGDAGHARAMVGDQPIVRMSNTFIENGDATLEELLEACGNGILMKGSRGGQVDPGRGVFLFNAEYGYLVEHGEIKGMVRDVSLSGEILTTLHNIGMAAKDRKMHQGFCGKGGQTVPVGDGSPHVLLHQAVVGGSGLD